MKYIKQLVIILLFCAVGQALEALIPLPVPAAIYGLVLLLIALCTGILKPAAIDETAHFLIRNMSLLFVAPAVNILQHWEVISPALATICIVTALSTAVVFAVSGVVTQLLVRKGGAAND